MQYTAITKKPMKVDTKTIEPGTRLEVVGLHDHTVSCRPPGSSTGLFLVLRTEVEIEEEHDKPVYEIRFTVSGYMSITVEVTEDVPCLADATMIHEALESGKIAISTTEDGDAILTADGTVVGRTHSVKDNTEWDDFDVIEAS